MTFPPNDPFSDRLSDPPKDMRGAAPGDAPGDVRGATRDDVPGDVRGDASDDMWDAARGDAPREHAGDQGRDQDGARPGSPAGGAGTDAAAGAGDRSAGPEPILAVDGVVAGYGGGDVLRGVSFTVAAGGITCVVGPNGAGKSTLLAAISGLLRPRLGTITLRGQTLGGKTPRQILALGIVHVPQRRSLFPDMTVRENVELGGFMIKEKAVVARRLAAIEEMFPIVAQCAGQKAGSLSGGQQRLVEFARCLMLDPALIILDEPSMGLAPKVVRSVFDAVRLINRQGKTILLVEQNARAGLRLSTHGVVLENGTVRLSGSGRAVLENPEIGTLYLGGAVSGAGSP
ncbi:MAG TPA: ABC transporter ATP-binding protein [Streptosporangiaceae bacterium]|nr:ABC transporter ATP-binding protein [Streptosporangiaceae bacterium]